MLLIYSNQLKTVLISRVRNSISGIRAATVIPRIYAFSLTMLLLFLWLLFLRGRYYFHVLLKKSFTTLYLRSCLDDRMWWWFLLGLPSYTESSRVISCSLLPAHYTLWGMISVINCLQNSFIIVVRNRGAYSWEFGWFLFKYRICDLIPEDLLPLREFRWLMIIFPY
jgi:hypothetical protein